jgi:hypothetical protein
MEWVHVGHDSSRQRTLVETVINHVVHKTRVISDQLNVHSAPQEGFLFHGVSYLFI